MISEEQFKATIGPTMKGASWDRVVTVFRKCGYNLSEHVTNVLLHALEQDKVGAVLGLLEEHYEDHLRYQPPYTRGHVFHNEVNLTYVLFNRIYTEILGLKPISEEEE